MKLIAAETSGARVITTEPGFDRVAASPQMLELLGQFCIASSEPEACFTDVPSIGVGCHSEVRNVDGMAVKISSDTTGRSAWLRGTSAPENLLNQFGFMHALAIYVNGNAEVTVPEQYLALRSRSGAFLSVQQYMRGWQPLQSWLDGQPTLPDNPAPILADVRDRIKNNIDNPLIRLGLEDLGLHKWQALHTKNVLVPINTARAEEIKVCIIDQPSQGLSGRLAVAGLRVAASLPSPLIGRG